MHNNSIQFSAEKLSIIRNYRSATFEDIAKAVGVAPTTVCQWESGEVKPTAQHVDKLAKFLNVQSLELSKNGGMVAASIVLAALENLSMHSASQENPIHSSGNQKRMNGKSDGPSKSHTFKFHISQGLWERLQKSMDQAGYPDEDVDLYLQTLIAEDYRQKLGNKMDWQ